MVGIWTRSTYHLIYLSCILTSVQPKYFMHNIQSGEGKIIAY